MVVILYLLVFPGLFAVGVIYAAKAGRRYDAFVDSTGRFDFPDLGETVETGPIRATLRAVRTSDLADKQVREGRLGPEAIELYDSARHARYLMFALLFVGALGVFLLTPVLAAITDRTGLSTNAITLVVLLAIAGVAGAILVVSRHR